MTGNAHTPRQTQISLDPQDSRKAAPWWSAPVIAMVAVILFRLSGWAAIYPDIRQKPIENGHWERARETVRAAREAENDTRSTGGTPPHVAKAQDARTIITDSTDIRTPEVIIATLHTAQRSVANEDPDAVWQPIFNISGPRTREYYCSTYTGCTWCPDIVDMFFLSFGHQFSFPQFPMDIDDDAITGTLGGLWGSVGTFDITEGEAVIAGHVIENSISYQLTLTGFATYWPDPWLFDQPTPFQAIFTVENATMQDGTLTGEFTSLFTVQTLPGNCVTLSFKETNHGTAAVDIPSPVVLVHGWNGSNGSWGGSPPNLKSLLEEDGWAVKYFSYEGDLATAIDGLAIRLDTRLRDWYGDFPPVTGKISIITHSMGGLIARYMLVHPAECPSAGKVQKLITLATPHYGLAAAIVAPGQQGDQMEFGSNFLWILQESWLGTPTGTAMLTIAGAEDDYSVPDDGVVLLPSACVENLGYPSCYVPNPHTGANGIAYIKDRSHPCYGPIASFLRGQIPPSNMERVQELTEGILIVQLVDPGGTVVPVGNILALGPRVWWHSDPTLRRFPPDWYAVNSVSGRYYATAVDPGTYQLDIHSGGGYTPIIRHSITIGPRETRHLSLMVYPASQSATESFAGGDTPPVTLGGTCVTVDLLSGPPGTIWVYKFDELPPDADCATLAHYWDIITDMPVDSFEAAVTFGYDDAEVSSAGLSEDDLVIAYYDTSWLPISSVVDTASNTVVGMTSHFTLFSIGDFRDLCDCPDFCDLNADGIINAVDVVVAVNYVYKMIDQRQPILGCSQENGDWNCSGVINAVDVVLCVNFVYKFSGFGPCDPCAQ